MPLLEGNSSKIRSTNIKREIKAGVKPSQAIAIAYSKSEMPKKKKKASS